MPVIPKPPYRKASPAPAPVYETGPLPPREQRGVEQAFTRLFGTDDGRLVLSHLQAMTFQRALGPDAPDTQLRYLEGQRAMIATILRMIERGRQEK